MEYPRSPCNDTTTGRSNVSSRDNRSHRATQSLCRVAHGVELGTFCHLNRWSSPSHVHLDDACFRRVVQKFPSEDASSHGIAQSPGVATFFSRMPTGGCCGYRSPVTMSRSQAAEPSASVQKPQPESEIHTRYESNPAPPPQGVRIRRHRPVRGCSGRDWVQGHPATTEQPMLSGLVEGQQKLSRVLLDVAVWRTVVARRNRSSQQCDDTRIGNQRRPTAWPWYDDGPRTFIAGPIEVKVSPVNRSEHGHSLTSASTQSKVLVTAFFQLRYRRSRSASSILGSQCLSSAQFLTTSSSPLQKPTAIPAA